MKKLGSVMTVVLALVASPCMATGLQMSWTECPGSPGAVANVAFDCDPSAGSVYHLLGLTTMPQFFYLSGAEFLIDLSFWTRDDVPAFWQIGDGGCNATGLVFHAQRPATGCANVSNVYGALAQGSVVLYEAPLAGAASSRARLHLSSSATGPDIGEINAGARVFLFDLQLSMDQASSCSGCGDPVAITWNAVTLYSSHGDSPITFTSAEPGSQPSVTANCPGDCQTIAAEVWTWGSLKALYRGR